MPATATRRAKTLLTTAVQDGFTFKAYRGCASVMLAFNLEDHLTEDLAGFSVRRKAAGGSWEPLMNRLNFGSQYTVKTTAKDRKWTPSSEAPFQKFWWVDFPPEDEHGEYTYEATVMRFAKDNVENKLVADQIAAVPVELGPFQQGNVGIGFTRGYLSSQAFADKVKSGKFNAQIAPEPQTIDYSTAAYKKEYEWLGFEARRMIFQFLEECLNDGAEVDLFAYDLNEPDFVRQLEKLGDKLRVIQDDSKEHVGAKALEPKAMALLQKADKCLGKFGRYAHDKVLIKKQNGKAVKVLTGSTNYSITGLYVNANNVLVFDDPNVSELYEQVFEAAFQSQAKLAKFTSNTLSKKEFEFNSPGLPHMFISFAPHANATTSLGRVVKEIKSANSSVLFAIMALQGTGQVLQQLKQIHGNAKVFSYGVTDSTGGAVVYRPGQKGGVLVPTPALTKNVPPPFVKEFTDGNAHRIHHKFVVVDFNDSDPVLFTGSSNLAEGGETHNGDNLLAIYDREIASAYAIEAIRLVDHYQFRAALQKATKAQPLQLGGKASQWWKDSYNPKSMKYKERLLFSR